MENNENEIANFIIEKIVEKRKEKKSIFTRPVDSGDLVRNFSPGAPRRSLNSAPNPNRHNISNIKSSNTKTLGAIFFGHWGLAN
jgi:hypothetical protein